ncbi:hypothetical protein G6F37_000693 [Rhizopus arrhizus]|nr:hypothetical protein G6F38_000857 [Rhizopus arrhizus]KAG1164010.1 hypothetical protein G6F37_000693 [Rhizopus arrhizus]
MPVSPESRSLWYRLFHHKLYSQSLPSSSHLTFTQDDVGSILWPFQQFPFVDNTDLWTLRCCVLSVIWRAYWRFTIDGFPLPLCRLCPALLTNDHTYKNPYWKSLLVKDVYGFNIIDSKLTPRGSFQSSQQRNRVEKYLDLLCTGQIAEEDSFVALKSSPNCALGGFVSSFGFQRPAPQLASLFSSLLPDGAPVEKLSTKWFRSLDILPLNSLPSTYPRASKSSWNKFWHTSIPHPARVVLWRFYHSNVPTRSRLHKIMPKYITDEGCIMCGAIETDEHFLWFCLVKRPIWDTLAQRFLV